MEINEAEPTVMYRWERWGYAESSACAACDRVG